VYGKHIGSGWLRDRRHRQTSICQNYISAL
jgi:hypothetical protein